MAAMPSPSDEPPNYVSLCNGTSTAWVLPSLADQAHYLGLLNLAFSDQANFAHIANQSRLPGILSDILELPSIAWNVSAGTKAFSVFANTIVAIDNNCQELHCKQEAQVINPKGKPKPEKSKLLPVPVSSSFFEQLLSHTAPLLYLASHKPSSDAALALLSQVDAMLEAMLLANDPNLVSCANLKKHQEAIEFVAQQQLFFLDIALQTFKLILD
ncbi:hypothetical protein C0989_001371 [Termitomyces sp. Mn162]|nr:hypothetical protein C0989_001371 [Termitomyces sp. Mn162]